MDVGLLGLLQLSIESQPVLLAAVPAIVGILFGGYYMFKTFSFHGKRLPPGSLGLPLFGESISFLKAQKHDKTQEWVETRIRSYGPIFKTSLMGKPTVVITGTAGNRFIFSDNDNAIMSNQPSTVSSIMGKYNTFELTGHNHKLLRSAMASFLKPESLQRYVRDMDSLIKQQIFQEFNGKESVMIVPFMKRITFNVACALLFRLPYGKELDSLFEDLTIALKGMWSLHLNFPTTSFYRAMAARRRIFEYFSKLIEERRKLSEGNASSENDAISSLLNLRDENGEELSEDMLVDNIMTLIIGSHDTSTILLTQFVRHLARDKMFYDYILEEEKKILREKEGTDERLTWNDIQKMKYTWRVAQELMRITPPVFGNFKRAITDTSFGGFHIPKGWQVFWVSSGTHMDEHIFPQPEKFDPSRFEPTSKSYPPYSYIPFGGGPHVCPGSEFARMEVLLIVHHLVTNYEWSEVIPNEPISRDPLPYPAMGLPIKLYVKSKEEICT
ncbi:cytochrome P450 716B1-like [Phoenix dactylifera]|uniref:Cytochrome P450 716B1-like n=1 Tax=Phoenix dactylifera TaxID=42345 RepID=A0A8B7BPI8_PHODC|nr:cytochrome P450 716B1-like [Phoenix dactylifera]